MVMQGKLTYNQCLDLDIAAGKNSDFDFTRIELLIDADFPSLRGAFDNILAERAKLHKVEAAFKRSYEAGEERGDEFSPGYVDLQQSLESLGQSLLSKITEAIRGLKS
jgi:hypothetical protein